MKGTDAIDISTLLISCALLYTIPPLGFAFGVVALGAALSRRSVDVARFILDGREPNKLIQYLLPASKKLLQDAPNAIYPTTPDLLTTGSNTDVKALDVWLEIVNNRIDDAPHTLIIGDTGAGKTSAAQAILATRGGMFVIADPKPKPGKWGGLPFVSVDNDGECVPIDNLFKEVLQEIKTRLTQMKAGKEDFIPLTVVVDEWPFVKGECPDTAPLLLKRLGSIGRELRVRLIALTQSDRVKSLGIEGEGDARGNFTILRLGKPAISVQPLTRSMERPACLEWRGDFLPITTNGVLDLSRRPINNDRLWRTSAVSKLFNANTPNSHTHEVGFLAHSEGSKSDESIESMGSEYDLLAAVQEKYELDRDALAISLLKAKYTWEAIKAELKKANKTISNNRLAALSKELKGE